MLWMAYLLSRKNPTLPVKEELNAKDPFIVKEKVSNT